MPAEETKKASVAFDRAKAVQDQQRASAAAAQDLELVGSANPYLRR